MSQPLVEGWAYDARVTTLGIAGAAIRGAASAARQAKTERRARAATVRAARSTWQAVRRAGLQVGALAAFTVAAWSVDFRLGLFIAGVCAIVLEGLLSE